MKQSPLRRATVAVAILAIGTAIGVSIGYARWHEPFDRFANARRIILNRADDFPNGGVLLIGDSTAERLHLPQLCGLPLFNAGMSGARADQIAPLARPLIASLKPHAVIVMAGANDRIQNDPWHEDVAGFAPRGAFVVGVPVELAQANGWRAIDALPASLLADGVHPSPAGRAEMKRRLSAAVCG